MIPTIGILAGMGPRSTAPFIEKVVNACRRLYNATDDIDYPPMMIYSLPTPFYPDREPDHEAMRDVIAAGVQRLEACGVQLIAVPCNTAHVYYDEMASAVSVPVLNMVSEAMAALPEASDSAAVFGTRPTIEAGLYQSSLALQGKSWVVASDWQDRIDLVIRDLKRGDREDKARRRWSILLDEAVREGADTAVLACTDLNAIQPVEPPLPLLDAGEVLAEVLVKRWLELRDAG